jgi:hypothetical protein
MHAANHGASERHACSAPGVGPLHGRHTAWVPSGLQNATSCPDTHVAATTAAECAKHGRHPPSHA